MSPGVSDRTMTTSFLRDVARICSIRMGSRGARVRFSAPPPLYTRYFSLLGLLLLLGIISGSAFSHTAHATASPATVAYPHLPTDPSQPCWDDAARYHGVDPWLLYAIARVESNYNPKAVNRANRNKTVDRGLMQINSVHDSLLKRHGIPENALYHACISTYIGAWVLSNNIRRYGYTWKAIASYNVGSVDTPVRAQVGLAYAKKVYAAYEQQLRRHRPEWAAQIFKVP